MATTIGNLAMIMSVNSAKWQSGLGAAAKGLSDFASRTTTVIGAVSAVGTGGIAGIGGALTMIPGPAGIAVGAMMQMGNAYADIINRGQEVISSIGSLAKHFDMSSQAAAMFYTIARRSGTDLGTLSGNLGHLQETLGQAAAGSAEAKFGFQALGLNFRELSASPINQTFGKVADSMNAMKNASERAAVAQMIFGKGWMEIDSILRKGSSGLQAAMGQIEVTAEMTARIKEQHEAVVQLQEAYDRLAVQQASTGAKLAQVGTAVTNSFVAASDWFAYALAKMTGNSAGLAMLNKPSTAGMTFDSLAGQQQMAAGLLAAQRMAAAAESPFVKLRDRIGEVNAAMATGHLPAQAYAATIAQAIENVAKLAGDANSYHAVGALTAGSSEAVSAMNQERFTANRNADPVQAMQSALNTVSELNRQQIALQQRIARAVERGELDISPGEFTTPGDW